MQGVRNTVELSSTRATFLLPPSRWEDHDTAARCLAIIRRAHTHQHQYYLMQTKIGLVWLGCKGRTFTHSVGQNQYQLEIISNPNEWLQSQEQTRVPH